MSKKVIIASDSTTDLSAELIAKYDVKILPLTVTLGDKQYRDGVDITPEDIYDHYHENKQLPKTAAVNAAEFGEFFKAAKEEDAEVVIFTISSDMSSTFNNARLAASEYDNVHVVDTRNLSTGGGLLVVHAGEMARDGKSASEIAEVCRELAPKVSASFVIDDLEFLYKGGRCSALAAFGANLLNLKPLIYVDGGKMAVGKKYRGKYSITLKKYVEDQLHDIDNIRHDRIFVTHAGCDPEIVEACVEQVKSYGVFRDIHITRASATISAHCGQHTLGVLFVRK